MFDVDSKNIYLTRGDYANIACNLKFKNENEEWEDYEMQDGDFLTLTVREEASKQSPVLLEIISLTNELKFFNDDTKNIPIGNYSADIQLTLSDGKRFTFWPEVTKEDNYNFRKEKNIKNFFLLSEVTTI